MQTQHQISVNRVQTQHQISVNRIQTQHQISVNLTHIMHVARVLLFHFSVVYPTSSCIPHSNDAISVKLRIKMVFGIPEIG